MNSPTFPPPRASRPTRQRTLARLNHQRRHSRHGTGALRRKDLAGLGLSLAAALGLLLWLRWPGLGGWLRHLPIYSLLPWLGAVVLLGLLVACALRVLGRGFRQRRQRAILEHLYIRRQTLRSLQTLDPVTFERYVGHLFELEGYRVAFTPRSGDEGIDLWLAAPDGRRLPVQCKRYSAEHRIGSPVLQTFSGALRKALAAEGYVVTTSTFTPAARTWAEQEGLHLIDGPALLDWQERLGYCLPGRQRHDESQRREQAHGPRSPRRQGGQR